jgi:sugar phosphate isomerase/epimerase
MYMTGFADEAAKDLAGQIRATQELGWKYIESRNIDGTNLHDLSEADFDRACGQLEEAGVKINCFGSAIANWAKGVDQPFDTSLAEARRAIPRMQRLGAKLVRIMSFAVLKDRGPEDQMEEERFRRVRELQRMFTEEGLLPVHENCMNYGGMGWTYTLRLIENVPGLKLVFDTGNPIFSQDRVKGADAPMQSSWEFYSHVKEHVAYIHIKDGVINAETGKPVYGWPGEGVGDVRRIMADLLASGYDGGVSIEPHIAVVHHEAQQTSADELRYRTYIEYGRRMEALIAEIRATESGSCPQP